MRFSLAFCGLFRYAPQRDFAARRQFADAAHARASRDCHHPSHARAGLFQFRAEKKCTGGFGRRCRSSMQLLQIS
jgi:hypothetical protein